MERIRNCTQELQRYGKDHQYSTEANSLPIWNFFSVKLQKFQQQTNKRTKRNDRKWNQITFYNAIQKRNWTKMPLLLSSSDASLFTQFAISYTLKWLYAILACILVYQSLGPWNFRYMDAAQNRVATKLWRFFMHAPFHIFTITYDCCFIFQLNREIFNPNHGQRHLTERRGENTPNRNRK